MTQRMVLLFAFCCGAIVANLYYAQPVISLIAPAIGLSAHAASLIVSLTQIGYGLGLLFLVPLGDLLENRRLMIATLLLSIVSLAVAAFAQLPQVFMLASLLIGFSSVSAQMLIPLAANLTGEETRGRVVGNIMSGLLFGILFARPLSGFVADHWGWRAPFGAAAVLMAVLAVILALNMPRRQPAHSASYAQLIQSLGRLFRSFPLLRQRTLYQACMFASFSLFWTAVPLELSRHYGWSQSQIAVFALIGATGAVGAPFSGRLADAGYTRGGTQFALLFGALSFVPALIWPQWSIVALAIGGIVLDFCVQLNLVLGQRTIYALDPASRSRLNGLYVGGLFAGGAIGSALASTLYERGGWLYVACAGAAFPALALLRFLLASPAEQGGAPVTP
jgi:predicted MFS family arabinose efflux permease